ncbi:MAG: HD-GYP domain-containing protein [Treponema sp.]|nr:HD-GYP domain-containing protein [Treponema sp.]
MNTFKTDEIKDSTSFNKDIFIDRLFIIEPAGVPVPQSVLKALSEWEFSEIISEGTISLGNFAITANDETDMLESQESDSEEMVSSSVKRSLEDAAKSRSLENSEKARLAAVQNVYNEYMNYINYVYTRYATHREINQSQLSDTVKDLCVFIKENRRYVLRITPSAEARSKNFLVTHSMRSAVLAITIGLQLHMSLSKLIELGMTTMLHEIGMIRLPPQLYLTDKQLSQSERAQIATHPVIGFEIVKELQFPLTIQLGVLEHHEKENGSGYPRHLTGEKISVYAKIIAVACSFEAITAPRVYKTERSTFDAMVEMLKNENHQYDETVIKALLYSLSLFPIGAYVYLINGKIGQVTDVNPDNPKNPLVQLLREKESDGTPKTVQTNDTDKKIVRVLSRQELDDVMKSLAAINNQKKQSIPTVN